MNRFGHGRITVALTIPVATVSIYYHYPWPITVAATLGVLSGLFIDPDLDMCKPTASRRRVYERSFIMGSVWQGFWHPYGRMIKHRSWWSHLPVVSTLIRLLYLLIPIALLHWFAVVSWAVDEQLLANVLQSDVFLAWVLGLMVSDVGHWLADGLPIRR